MGDGPKVYNPKPADQFMGKGTLNTEGPFVDVRRRLETMTMMMLMTLMMMM